MQPANGWLFDVDGVLTAPESKRFANLRLLDEIVKLLEAGEPVGANSGRSLAFLEERFLNPIEDRVSDRRLLQHVFVAAEKGGAWLAYDGDGFRRRFEDELLVTHDVTAVLDDVRRVVRDAYSNLMAVDESKRLTITIEMIDGATPGDFRAKQPEVAERVENILSTHRLSEHMRVDQTRIAIDIEWTAAGKALGARRYLRWLDDRGAPPRRFFAFGDSPSDFDMALELRGKGKDVQFVCVGGAEGLDGRAEGSEVPILVTKNHFDQGTLEFLQFASPRRP